MKVDHHVDSYFVATMLLTFFKPKISIKIVTIQETIHKDYLYDVLYKNSWLAKQKLLERLFGSHKEF